MFDKFVQLDPSRAGAGLGLYISRSIVEALGGTMWIEDRLGGGCRVSLALPAPRG